MSLHSTSLQPFPKLKENHACKALMTELLENRTDGPIVPKITKKTPVYSKGGALTADPLENKYKTLVLPKRFSRKQKQLKLKQAIPRNFQGYPISQCIYAPNLQDHVYIPSKWKNKVDKLEFEYANCCTCCCLKPCVTEVFKVSFLECLKKATEDCKKDGFIFTTQDVVKKAGKCRALKIFKDFCGNAGGPVIPE